MFNFLSFRVHRVCNNVVTYLNLNMMVCPIDMRYISVVIVKSSRARRVVSGNSKLFKSLNYLFF